MVGFVHDNGGEVLGGEGGGATTVGPTECWNRANNKPIVARRSKTRHLDPNGGFGIVTLELVSGLVCEILGVDEDQNLFPKRKMSGKGGESNSLTRSGRELDELSLYSTLKSLFAGSQGCNLILP